MLRPTLRGLPLRTLCPPRTPTSTPSSSALRKLTTAAAEQPTQPTPEAEPTPPPPTKTTLQPPATAPITHTIPLSPRPPPPSAARNSPEAYAITRTPSNGLPVYQFAKAGGNLQLTRVRRVVGDAQALRAQLEAALTPTPRYVRVNGTTGHVVVRGWYKKQIEQFLAERGF